VRRLKKLGLTQSFEVGYELSPRGEELMRRRGRRRARGERSSSRWWAAPAGRRPGLRGPVLAFTFARW